MEGDRKERREQTEKNKEGKIITLNPHRALLFLFYKKKKKKKGYQGLERLSVLPKPHS